MSGAPKRPYEEGGHSSSKHTHEEPGSHSRLPSTEYHPPYDMSQDSRMSKIARTESRDMDRRSPIQSVYRMPLSFNDSHSDHPGRPNNNLDSKDPKDNKEITRDSRDAKIEKRGLCGDAKKDSQSAKGEKDTKHNVSKDMLHEKESYYDSKGGTKIDKDGYGGAASHSSLKESNDYHRGKGYFESPGGNVDSWHISRSNSQGPVELGKDGSITDGRGHVEVREAVDENRVDSKGEDRHKDRRRQDMKHRDWAEKEKERSEHKVSLQVGMSSGDCKESTKEEDAEKWKRDGKEFSREKERPKEREKEQVKQDPWNGIVKQNLHNEKDARDAPTRMSEQENLVSDQKKQKEPDGLDNAQKEGKDRKKERDTDGKGDRSGKRKKGNEKEREDGGIDGEGTNEKEREREASGYGVQHKRRMLRARSSPQRANREPRFKACSAEIEGSQGKTDDSAVVYKIGECMHELIKLWKEHEASQTDKSAECSQNGPALEIRIPAEHVTATNRQVRGGQLWGTDVYTYDSDLVAVLMHTGYCRPTGSPPPPAIQELRATIRVLPPQDCYVSTLRNNVRSRAWGSAIGCSYRVERCCIVKKGGGTINLEPCLTHASTVEPTIAPVAVERTMTTRAAASNALRQQRFLREVTIQYNLCNEPWIKYSLNVVADKGLKKPLYTSARLKKGEVLYLETHTTRYELCFTGEKVIKAALASLGHEGEVEKPQNHHSNSTNGDRNDSDNIVVDLFRWSRCKRPLPQNLMRSIGIPLPLEHVQVLEDNLEWEDVQWSQTGVWVNGKEYPLARVHFLAAD